MKKLPLCSLSRIITLCISLFCIVEFSIALHSADELIPDTSLAAAENIEKQISVDASASGETIEQQIPSSGILQVSATTIIPSSVNTITTITNKYSAIQAHYESINLQGAKAAPALLAMPTQPEFKINGPTATSFREHQAVTIFADVDVGSEIRGSLDIGGYQWQVSKNNGQSWRNIGTMENDSLLYLNETTSALMIIAVSSDMIGWSYRYSATVSTTNDSGITSTTGVSAPYTLPNIKSNLLNRPTNIAISANGDLYVSDMHANTIWKITSTGVISIFAGNPNTEAGAVDGTGTNARFNMPQGLVWHDNNIYVADSWNNAIRVISQNGNVRTFAGSLNESGYTEGTGTAARFYWPTALVMDSTGNLYVGDSGNNVIRKVTSRGATSHVAGSKYYYTGGISGTTSYGGGVFSGGNAGVVFGGSGTTTNVPIYTGTDSLTLATGSTSPNGIISLGQIGVTTGGSIFTGSLNLINGNGLIISSTSHASSSTNLTFSGTNDIRLGAAPQEYPTSDYYFFNIRDMIFSSDGKKLYVTDAWWDTLCEINIPTGSMREIDVTISGQTPSWLDDYFNDLSYPCGLILDKNNNLIAANSYHNTLITISPSTGNASVFAGSILNPGLDDGDGNPLTAQFNLPMGLAKDSKGTIYIADFYNAAVRKITFSGTKATVSTIELRTSSSPIYGGGGSDDNSGGGGAPSAWYLLSLLSLAALRLRRR